MPSSSLIYLVVETVLRIGLLVLFFVSENLTPFQRIIQPEEWWLYKNPMAQNEVVNTTTLFCTVLTAPVITIFLVNYVTRKWRKVDVVPAVLVATLTLLLNGIITNFIKLMVGRPRPDFFFRCYPDGKPPKGQPSTYDLRCTGDPYIINGGRKSFPSGHSSFSFASLGFCALYLAGKLRVFTHGGRGSTLRLLVALTPIMIATFIVISRTSDYRHHWQDVVAGSILGLLVALVCYRQHYPPLSDAECNMPYMKTEPHDLEATKSFSDLQSVDAKRF